MDKQKKGIVILGHPRSGTTLLRRLLNGHARIACPPETHLLSACARFLEAEHTASGVDMGVLAGLNFAGFEDEIVLQKLRDFAFAFLEDYAKHQGKARWAEKTAFDSFYLDGIDQLCSDQVLYVGIVRHGLDVAVSSKEFCDAAGLYPKVMHDYIRRYPHPIEAFAHSWLEVNQNLLELCKRNKENSIIFQYEDLVKNPNDVLKKLLDFVGEEFDPEMLERGLVSNDQLGFSDHKSYQSRKIEDTHTERWRALPEPQVQKLAPILNPLLEHFGYDSLQLTKAISTKEARQRYTAGLRMVAPAEKIGKLVVPKENSAELLPLNYYGQRRAEPTAIVQAIRRIVDNKVVKKIQAIDDNSSSTLTFSVILLALLKRITDNNNFRIGILSPKQTNQSSTEVLMEMQSLQLSLDNNESFETLYPKCKRALQIETIQNLDKCHILLNYNPEVQTDDVKSLRVNIELNKKQPQHSISFDFNEGVWPEKLERERLVEHFFQLMYAYLDDQNNIIDKVSILTNEEKNTLEKFNNNCSKNKPQSVINRFIEQIAINPNHPAIVFENNKLSYKELGTRVSQLSIFLKSKGIGTGSYVAICVYRSVDMVTALLAVMHVGGTYVPLDPHHPESRISQILEDVKPSLLLSEQSLYNKLGSQWKDIIICLDDEEWLQDNPIQLQKVSDNGNLAYIIFTSGSTGRPKGVEVCHYGLNRFLEAMEEKPGIDQRDRLLAVTTLSFDIAGLEIFLPIINGATVYIATHYDAMDGKALMNLLDSNKITIFQATPTTYQILVANGWKGSTNIKLLCGGEAFPPNLANSLIDRCSELWNMYGPTETTIWSTTKKIVKITTPLSIGYPIKGTQTYILNSQLSPVPLGVAGELYIAGDGLARGYFERSDLTKQQFVRNLFSVEKSSRMYRTGDSARYLEDGSIEYIGRLDNQVKLRGYRIELGEIEVAINSHDNVSQCVVAVQETTPDTSILVAYIILDAGVNELTSDELHQYLASRLPTYMIPSSIVILEGFPLTPNNKVDRKALPIPISAPASISQPEHSESSRDNYVAPTTKREKELVELWEKILRIQPVGIEDNFFDLGGDSLSAVTLILEMEKQGISEADCRGLFQGRTIAEIVAPKNSVAEETGPKVNTSFLNNLLVNNLRGFMILMLIASHWMPGLLERLPLSWGIDIKFIRPILSIGTPGFAIVFGIGLGYLLYENYKHDRLLFKKKIRASSTILFYGWILLSVLGIIQRYLDGINMDIPRIISSFYGIFLFYMVATLTVPIWFKTISFKNNEYRNAFLLIVLFFALDYFIRFLILDYEQVGFAQLIRLMFVAKFAYFNLAAGAVIGILIGIKIRNHIEKPDYSSILKYGVILVFSGLAIGTFLGQVNELTLPSSRIDIWKWLFYAGIVNILIWCLWKVISSYEELSDITRNSLNILSLIGAISFPLFIMQNLVLKLKRILDSFGVPDTLGLATVLLIFMGITWVLVRKLYSLYFFKESH